MATLSPGRGVSRLQQSKSIGLLPEKRAVQSTPEQPVPTPPASTASTRTSALSPRSPRNSRVAFAPQQASAKQKQQQQQQQQQEHSPKQARLSQESQPQQQSLQQPRACSPSGSIVVSTDASKQMRLPRHSSPVDSCLKGVRASRHSIAAAPRPHADLALPSTCASTPRCGPQLLHAVSRARSNSPPRAASPLRTCSPMRTSSPLRTSSLVHVGSLPQACSPLQAPAQRLLSMGAVGTTAELAAGTMLCPWQTRSWQPLQANVAASFTAAPGAHAVSAAQSLLFSTASMLPPSAAGSWPEGPSPPHRLQGSSTF